MPRIRILKDSPLYRLRESLDVLRYGPSEEGDIAEATFHARELASEWHSGQADPLYGFSSTGDLEFWGSVLIDLPTGEHTGPHGRIMFPAWQEALDALREYASAMHAAGKFTITEEN